MFSMRTASATSPTAVAYPWFDFNDAVAVEPRLDKEDIRARLIEQL